MHVVSAEQVYAWQCGVEILDVSVFMPDFLIQAPPVSSAKAPPVSTGKTDAVGGAGKPSTELVKPTDTSKVQVYKRQLLCSGIFIASWDMPEIHHLFTLFQFYQSTSCFFLECPLKAFCLLIIFLS